MTSKAPDGARGIVVGSAVRLWHERGPSNSAKEWRRRLHQFAMSTRAGTKCAQATIGVVEHTSTKAMLAMPGNRTLPFVRSFCGQLEEEFHHIDRRRRGTGGRSHAPNHNPRKESDWLRSVASAGLHWSTKVAAEPRAHTARCREASAAVRSTQCNAKRCDMDLVWRKPKWGFSEMGS